MSPVIILKYSLIQNFLREETMEDKIIDSNNKSILLHLIDVITRELQISFDLVD